MTFREAVESIPGLKEAYYAGWQALRPMDADHVTVAEPRKLAGSVDLDSSGIPFPKPQRWDYAIGCLQSSKGLRIYWVEIHPANSGQINPVIQKLQSLLAWLEGAGKPLNSKPREFIWISSGNTTFTLNAPQKKQFALLGLQHRGGHLRIP